MVSLPITGPGFEEDKLDLSFVGLKSGLVFMWSLRRWLLRSHCASLEPFIRAGTLGALTEQGRGRRVPPKTQCCQQTRGRGRPRPILPTRPHRPLQNLPALIRLIPDFRGRSRPRTFSNAPRRLAPERHCSRWRPPLWSAHVAVHPV